MNVRFRVFSDLSCCTIPSIICKQEHCIFFFLDQGAKCSTCKMTMIFVYLENQCDVTKPKIKAEMFFYTFSVLRWVKYHCIVTKWKSKQKRSDRDKEQYDGKSHEKLQSSHTLWLEKRCHGIDWYNIGFQIQCFGI